MTNQPKPLKDKHGVCWCDFSCPIRMDCDHRHAEDEKGICVPWARKAAKDHEALEAAGKLAEDHAVLIHKERGWAAWYLSCGSLTCYEVAISEAIQLASAKVAAAKKNGQEFPTIIQNRVSEEVVHAEFIEAVASAPTSKHVREIRHQAEHTARLTASHIREVLAACDQRIKEIDVVSAPKPLPGTGAKARKEESE